MAALLLLTNAMTPSAEVLPALGLLGHSVRVAPAEVAALVNAPQAGLEALAVGGAQGVRCGHHMSILPRPG